MPFLKYPSIENHYREKYIQYWLIQYPELFKTTYEITEKIHGTNLQLIFERDNNDVIYKVASRNRILNPDENFFDVFSFLDDNYLKIIEPVLNYMKRYNHTQTLNFYGEFCGPGIQAGVDYGNEKRLLFFNTAIKTDFDDGFITPNDFADFLDCIYSNYLRYLVPIKKIVFSLDEALAYEVEGVNSELSDKEDNQIEGVVIKPYDKVYYDENDQSVFSLKKKSIKFLESKPHKHRDPVVVNEEIKDLMEKFNTYINKNRVESIFSKEGKIQDYPELKKYIPLIMQDAIEDFMKDFDISHLDKKERKLIFRTGGSLISKLLRENYL